MEIAASAKQRAKLVESEVVRDSGRILVISEPGARALMHRWPSAQFHPTRPASLRSSSSRWLTPVRQPKRDESEAALRLSVGPSRLSVGEGRSLSEGGLFQEVRNVLRLPHPERDVSRTAIYRVHHGPETTYRNAQCRRISHTSKYKPRKLIGYHAFAEKRKAQEFEYYLKTGSGKAFASKRLW